ncbi:hypothetical protein HPB48_018821 [Haemaphysalis longicornis]|uniref:Uncharacterized protein n=1 Tax=Haemaphysalis longicornis TaxID=44386 RepID=A0A9J6FY24_HAELO|nr:hypothetical protein HPB48_018821 [Haemaphysalis longicornis]
MTSASGTISPATSSPRVRGRRKITLEGPRKSATGKRPAPPRSRSSPEYDCPSKFRPCRYSLCPSNDIQRRYAEREKQVRKGCSRRIPWPPLRPSVDAFKSTARITSSPVVIKANTRRTTTRSSPLHATVGTERILPTRKGRRGVRLLRADDERRAERRQFRIQGVTEVQLITPPGSRLRHARAERCNIHKSTTQAGHSEVALRVGMAVHINVISGRPALRPKMDVTRIATHPRAIALNGRRDITPRANSPTTIVCAQSMSTSPAAPAANRPDVVLGRVEDDRDLFSRDVSLRILRVTALRSALAQPADAPSAAAAGPSSPAARRSRPFSTCLLAPIACLLARQRARAYAPNCTDGPPPASIRCGEKSARKKTAGAPLPPHQHHHATQTRRRENGPGCREESSPPSCCRRKKANERRDNANRATGLAASLPNESATRTRRPHAAVERARRRPPLDPRASSTSGAVRAPKTRREPVAALHAPAVSELPKAVSKQAPFVSVSPSNRILGGFESNPRACRDRTSDAEGIAENPSNRARLNGILRSACPKALNEEARMQTHLHLLQFLYVQYQRTSPLQGRLYNDFRGRSDADCRSTVAKARGGL